MEQSIWNLVNEADKEVYDNGYYVVRTGVDEAGKQWWGTDYSTSHPQYDECKQGGGDECHSYDNLEEAISEADDYKQVDKD